MKFHYVWLVWSSAFLIPWVGLYALRPRHRRAMRQTSAVTALFGLTEPLFVPAYWNPPSLFDLARRTGFDLESIIFAFAIGGLGAVLYNGLTGKELAPIDQRARSHPRHRLHRVALVTPVITFPILYLLPWNVIYASMAAMLAATIAGMLCRPDLLRKTWIGGLLFLGFYAVFLFGLKWSARGYIDAVWNLPALSGFRPFGVPLEELLFGLTFGLYWAGVYEHVAWLRLADPHTQRTGADHGPCDRRADDGVEPATPPVSPLAAESVGWARRRL
jgi:hypothetical protein